jgi:hypothetical protein
LKGVSSLSKKPLPNGVMLGGSIFYNIKSGAKLYVPNASLEAYRTSSKWRAYFNTPNIGDK